MHTLGGLIILFAVLFSRRHWFIFSHFSHADTSLPNKSSFVMVRADLRLNINKLWFCQGKIHLGHSPVGVRVRIGPKKQYS